MILKLFRPVSPDRNIRDLYGVIVAQARSPAFYSGYGVPDTVQGRFDLIVLHLVLVLARLGQDDGTARMIGQKLFDEFCRDLDDNLREMGVGDLAVPKRMRSFAEAFYGRQAAYLAALAAADQRELENALARNIFESAKGESGPARLAVYIRATLQQFAARDQRELEAPLLRGQVVFPKPESIAGPIAGPSQQRAFKRARKMGEQKPQKSGPAPSSPGPWHVPVTLEDVPETGRHFDMVAEDGVRAAIAAATGLRELPRLQANFNVTRRGADGLHVSGSVSATVGQTCVVTLEPIANEIGETVDLTFVPQQASEPSDDDDTKPKPRDVKWDDPEPLVGGTIDLGALATEFLIVGINPYPRKPDAVFESRQEDIPDPGPFAALAKLAKD